MVSFFSLGKLGRLGNQLWQIASTIGIADSNGHDYVFPEWEYKKYFYNHLPTLKEYPSSHNAYITQNEVHHHYSKYNLDPDKNYCLHGFFQSEKYFKNCKEDVLKYFQFKEGIVTKCRKKLSDISNGNNKVKLIGLHVRRGDYVDQKHNFEYLTMEYYGWAISHFLKLYGDNVIFVVCSDSISSCVADFYSQFHSCNFYYSKDFNEVEDLCLLSICDGIICANSSFSSWAAILGDNPNKVIIQPKKWFGSYLSKTHSAKDVYCEKAILL